MNEIKPKNRKANAVRPQTTSNPRPEQIALLAYHIWEQEGRPAGREQEHWLQAESQMKSAHKL